MKRFNALPIDIRINLFVSLIFLGMSTLIVAVFYIEQRRRIIANTEEQVLSQIDDFIYLIENEDSRKTNQLIVTSTIRQFFDNVDLIDKRPDTCQRIGRQDEMIERLFSQIALYNDTTSVVQYIKEKKLYFNGFAYMVDSRGKIVFHRSLPEGYDIATSQSFRDMKEDLDGRGSSRYYIAPDKKDKIWRRQFYKYAKTLDVYVVITFDESALFQGINRMQLFLAFAFILSIALLSFLVRYYFRPFKARINDIIAQLRELALGRIPENLSVARQDEVALISASLNDHLANMRRNAIFAGQIENGEMESAFTPASTDDVLGNALLSMRDSLAQAARKEKVRGEQEARQRWISEGVANFSDMLRQNYDNIRELSYAVLEKLIEYVNANLGGIFWLRDEEKSNIHLELLASYAYDRRKYISKTIMPGEGLIGMCALEKKTVFMTKLPDNYIEIGSGLGNAKPRCLMIIPLKHDDRLLGVMEIASFRLIEQHEREFIERIADSIAATMNNAKINEETARLLEMSKIQSEEMASQEEEMRQNMEELQATQEEAERKEMALTAKLDVFEKNSIYVEYDRAGRILDISREYLCLLGATKSEFVGKEQLYTSDADKDLRDYAGFWKRLRQGERLKKIARIEHRGHTLFLAETYFQAGLENDDKIFFVKIATDITDALSKHRE